MGITVIPNIDAVTAVKYHNGKVIIVVFGYATYYRQITRYRYLKNSHHMRSNEVVVEDKYKDLGES